LKNIHKYYNNAKWRTNRFRLSGPALFYISIVDAHGLAGNQFVNRYPGMPDKGEQYSE